MTRSPLATVLMPTHNHDRFIGYALRSIQDQTFSDFELFVVGDGASPKTRVIVDSFARADARIRYFDFPKGQRHGELNRHLALQEARGRIIAYCGDDDLWLPGHLRSLTQLLKRADFGHNVQINLHSEGEFVVYPGTLSDPECRRGIREGKNYFFGLSVTGHRTSAYRCLSEGWSPAPVDIPTDQFMWRKFIGVAGLRLETNLEATSIHIASPLRRCWTVDERELELNNLFKRRTTGGLRLQLETAIRKAHPNWIPPPENPFHRLLKRIGR